FQQNRPIAARHKRQKSAKSCHSVPHNRDELFAYFDRHKSLAASSFFCISAPSAWDQISLRSPWDSCADWLAKSMADAAFCRKARGGQLHSFLFIHTVVVSLECKAENNQLEAD
ncbi:hypothetical protein, partial [Pseudomonas kitaguniensis]|uniref:hypothetical protein n=1 Tax=Pseudomonas kitaguniensis TaxID=2607908 RepID=UPI0019D6A213